MNKKLSMRQLGWQPYFQQQLTLTELETHLPVRVVEHHRTHYKLQAQDRLVDLPVEPKLPELTVGDWLLLNNHGQFVRQLERKSLFKRKAAGTKVSEQFIAANVDTLFIVSSLNADFNLNRIERYLALAHEAEVEPVVVLTKSDLCADSQDYKQQVQRLDPMLMVEVVNSLDRDSVKVLQPWCGEGKTVSFIGSSGVGKSTLANTLLAQQRHNTAGIREDDSKGRHTTRARVMSFIDAGGAIIDLPGMRELQLTDCPEGVQQTFEDIEQLAQLCKFSDCSHTTEPGCAVQAATLDGRLEQRRVNNYQKLLEEQARNSATLKQKRDRDKAFSKHVKTTMVDAVAFKRGY